MPELLEKYLHNWVEKHYRPNPNGYLFLNSKDRPFISDNVIRYGVHKTMAKLGIARPPGGVHVMRHGDPHVTLAHYAHVIVDAERVASEKFSQRIGAQLEPNLELEPVSPAKTV